MQLCAISVNVFFLLDVVELRKKSLQNWAEKLKQVSGNRVDKKIEEK